MSLSEAKQVKLELRLATLAQAESTGVLEVFHGKRRRRFYLQDGELVGTTSNLKKEQPGHLTADLAGAPPETIHEHVAAARLASALANEPSKVAWNADKKPKRAVRTRLWVVIFSALELAFETDPLIERLASEREGNPRCKASTSEQLAGLGLPIEYREWLAALDGYRTVHDVIQFGPGEPRSCVAAIFLAWLQGALAFSEVDLAHAVAHVPEEDSEEIIDEDAEESGSVFASLTSLIEASVTPHEGGGADDEEPEPEPEAPPAQEPEPDFQLDLEDDSDDISLDNDDISLDNDEPHVPIPDDVEIDFDDDDDDVEIDFDDDDDDVEIDFDDDDDFELGEEEDTNVTSQDWSIDAGEASLRAEIHRIQQSENVFDVLGVAHDAEVETFRSSYFHLARILHPDRVGDDDPELQREAAEAFDRARAAWEIVKDDEKREETIARVIHGKKSEEEEAMEAVQEMLAIEKLVDKGVAEFKAGRIVKAHEILQQAIEKSARHPDFEVPELRVYMGYCLWRLNHERDEDEAARGVEMLQNAMNKNQRNQEGWILLGRVVKARGHPEEARKLFIKTLKLNPENKDALREMERLKREKEGGSGGKGKKGFFGRLFGGKKDKKSKKKRKE